MLHHLEELAEQVGIEVRYQPAAGRVGICLLQGTRVAIIDANLRVPERVAALASVLAEEELNGVYIPPAVRRRLLGSSPLRVRPEDQPQKPDTAEAAEAELEPPIGEDEDTTDSGHVHEDGDGPEADAEEPAVD